ncbi:MAG: low molecular weight protein-tyrosine-phosphatase [Gemmobacter sp.]
MRILLVCLGNICRSPAAEVALRARAQAAGLTASFESCGTGDWHRGEPPHPPMIAAAARIGLDLTGLRARQIAPADFAGHDLLLAMDRQNLRDIEALRPRPGGARAQLYLSVLPDAGPDVPDPWFTRDFDGVMALIDRAAGAWVDQLRAQSASAASPKER